jgi:hypothetical protein
LCELLHAGHIKLFAEVSELVTHAEFLPVIIHKMAFLKHILHVAKRMEVGEW